MSEVREYVSVRGYAEQNGVKRQYIEQVITAGRLPFITISGHKFININSNIAPANVGKPAKERKALEYKGI